MFRKLDGSMITLILVIVIFIGSIFYLRIQDTKTENLRQYYNHIQTLNIYEKDFYNFLVRSLDFSNYDMITAKLDFFDKVLYKLESSTIAKNFDPRFENKLTKIRTSFQQERELLEYHKSINATSFNSIHYLFDLRNNIMLSKNIETDYKTKIDTTLFMMMELVSGLEADKEKLKGLIQSILFYSEWHENSYLRYFYTHSKILLENIEHLKTPLLEHKEIALSDKISQSSLLLELIYEEKRKNDRLLNFILILIFITLLIVLILLHIRGLKIRRELISFRFAVENSDNTIMMTDLQNNIIYVNESFENSTGYSKEEVIGGNPNILKSGLTDNNTFKKMHKKLQEGKRWEGEFINKRKDGTLFYEKVSIMPIFLNNKVVSYLAIKIDITEYIEQQNKLQLAATVFDNSEEGIVITDVNLNILSINHAFEEMSGYTQVDCIGKTPKIFQSGLEDDYFYQNMWNALQNKGHWKGKIRDRAKNGNILYVWLNISEVKDDKGKVTHYISFHTDLQEIIDTEKRIDYLAYHDSLTDLPNRLHFSEAATHAIALASRNQTKLAILFIDLDRFKIINDTLGHHIGDELLKTVAMRIQNVLRQIDTLARVGGDEFVVMLEAMYEKDHTVNIAENISNALSQPIEIEGYSLTTSASIGISLYPDNGEDVETLLKNADTAMYRAKALGKNTFHYYTDSLSDDMHYRLLIEQGLRNAIANNEFHLNFQPQYDLKTHEVIAVESLLRWENTTLGLISPNEFIPIAEDSGLMQSIGNFIFEETCKAMEQFKRENINLKYIAINVSSQQFRQKNLVQYLKDMVKQYKINPSQIEIEITERYIMEHTEDNLSILDDLRTAGFKISIDDFGTGYSSMSYLKTLPLDTIKIDKSFVNDIPNNLNDVEITKAILALAKSLNYTTIAEGIETKEQERFLQEQGCDIGQGYFFSKPLNEKDFIGFMKVLQEKIVQS